MRAYDRIAAWFTAVRNPEVGVPALAELAQTLPPGARVLDLGCGDGVPVSRFLVQQDFALTALDSSPEMVRRYLANFPGVPARCVRAQDAPFAPGSFEAVVAWGVLFHLAEADHPTVIERVAGWLQPGGRFLFTSGDGADVSESEMNGVTFRYVSLGVEAYRALLERAGMLLERHGADAWQNYVYVAVKASTADGMDAP